MRAKIPIATTGQKCQKVPREVSGLSRLPPVPSANCFASPFSTAISHLHTKNNPVHYSEQFPSPLSLCSPDRESQSRLDPLQGHPSCPVSLSFCPGFVLAGIVLQRGPSTGEASLRRPHKSWALDGGQQLASRDGPGHTLQKATAQAQRGQGCVLEKLHRVGAKVPETFSFCHNQPLSFQEVPTATLADVSWTGFLPQAADRWAKGSGSSLGRGLEGCVMLDEGPSPQHLLFPILTNQQ